MAKDVAGQGRRKARVRRAIRAAAFGKARLSVFRSSKQIYAQINSLFCWDRLMARHFQRWQEKEQAPAANT